MEHPSSVAAGHPDTASAGRRVLDAGGTAVDAAVAMMLTACAAEQLFTGLSGGGFATVRDRDGTVTCVDFFVAVPGLDGRRPGVGTPISVNFAGHQVPYDVGPPTVAAHGIPAGARHLWERWGRLSWERVVQESVRVAERGAVFPEAHATLLHDVTAAMCVGEGRQVFCGSDGRPLTAGSRLHHPELAGVLRRFAADPECFGTGTVAEAIVAATADGGALSAADLASYAVVESWPRTIDLVDLLGRPLTVHARGDDLDDLLGTLEAVSARVLGDPLVDPASAVALAEELAAPDRRTETTNLVAVDAEGAACVITCSLGLGSTVWVSGTGLHLNSMMGEGELIRGEPVPGARMWSMMSPLVVTDADGRLVLAAGSAGGSRIRPALVQTVLRMIRGATAQQAIDAPRMVATPGAVRLEPGFTDAVRAALAPRFSVDVTATALPFFGGVSAVTADGPGADRRRDGAVG